MTTLNKTPAKRALRRIATFAVAAGFAVAAAVPAHADVVNGSFETGDFTGWTQTGNTTFNGVECPGAPFAGPGDGNCDAFFGPVGSIGGISQNVATTVGGSYNINFDFQPDGGTPSSFAALWGAQTLISVTNPAASAYQVLHFVAQATTATTTLAFNFRDDPGFLKLDSVSVTKIPEPGTMALLGIGIAGLWAGRRRKAQ
jgi:hypothetical protein